MGNVIRPDWRTCTLNTIVALPGLSLWEQLPSMEHDSPISSFITQANQGSKSSSLVITTLHPPPPTSTRVQSPLSVHVYRPPSLLYISICTATILPLSEEYLGLDLPSTPWWTKCSQRHQSDFATERNKNMKIKIKQTRQTMCKWLRPGERKQQYTDYTDPELDPN